MLLPGFLGHIADKAVELWEQLNLFAIRDICRRIADAGNHMTASAEWQIYKMEQSGMSRDAIMRAVSRVMKLSDEEVRRIFEEAAIESHNNDADVFTEAGVQPEPFGTEQAGKSMQVYYEQTNNELRNYTRTTALQSQQIFINACDGAFLAVQSGLKSSAEAIRDAIDDAARDGLYVHYPSGHRDTVEVAVRRAVMTGVNRAALQMTVDECQRTGTNYVIVSSHLGARVSDSNPIADHAGWQGKVYRLSNERESFWGKLKGFLPFLRGRKYPLLREATGYPDDPLGLGGYNCRHSMYPYIPGVTENHMKQFDPEKNRKAFEDSQRQRAMEREIRKKKRQVEGLKAAAEASEGEQLEAIEELLKKRKKELADLTAKYRQFCKDNGLSENLERTYIAKRIRGLAKSAKYDTGANVHYSPEYRYEIQLEGYSESINDLLSQAAKEVAENGELKRVEYMRMVDLTEGTLLDLHTNDDPGAVWESDETRAYMDTHPNSRFALVHNHITDSMLSEEDMQTLFDDKQIDVMVAVRNDAIIYVAEKGECIPDTMLFEDLYPDDVRELNRRYADGTITAGQRTLMRAEMLVNNVIRDYCKGGKKTEINGRD